MLWKNYPRCRQALVHVCLRHSKMESRPQCQLFPKLALIDVNEKAVVPLCLTYP
jgi:hypothetical protein